MECPICLKQITNSYSLPCLHHFCKKCILTWCEKKDTCPKCRIFIYFIKPDPEFDELNEKFQISSNNSLENLSYNNSLINFDSINNENNNENNIENNNQNPNIKICIINFDQYDSQKIGLTLTSNDKNEVIVTHVEPKGLAATCGIQKKSLLLTVNDIPCINHKQTIKIIDFSKIINQSIYFKIILPPSSSLSRICGNLIF